MILSRKALPMRWWEGKDAPAYYTYSPKTGEYLESGFCDPSPLEPGVWLWPGSSTAAAPPVTGPNQVAVYNIDTKRWRKEPDHRGEVRWHGGEFKIITGIGSVTIPPMQVHDAEYLLTEGSVDRDGGGLIRMWINDDVIEFRDDPELLARRVLAGWEAQGETIRPVSYDRGDNPELVPEPIELTEEELAEANAAAQAAFERQIETVVDKRVQNLIESGTRLPREEQQP